MGLLNTKPVTDPRLTPGAYLRRGACLYRVHMRTPAQITLEDCYRSNAAGAHMKATTAGDVLAHYDLVVAASHP